MSLAVTLLGRHRSMHRSSDTIARLSVSLAPADKRGRIPIGEASSLPARENQ
jgi:hypothetical protein